MNDLPREQTFELLATGNYPAICYQFVDLGTQVNTYEGETTERKQCMLRWEICNEKMDNGELFTINEWYTWSMGTKAKLRQHLDAWRDKPFSADERRGITPFDIKNMLGTACMLNIDHKTDSKGELRAKITAVGKLPKGMIVPPLVHDILYFSLHPDRFDKKVLAKLPEKIQALIKASPEYQWAINPLSQQVSGLGPDPKPKAPAPARPSIHEELNEEIPWE
jgi:hypothetical protein